MFQNLEKSSRNAGECSRAAAVCLLVIEDVEIGSPISSESSVPARELQPDHIAISESEILGGSAIPLYASRNSGPRITACSNSSGRVDRRLRRAASAHQLGRSPTSNSGEPRRLARADYRSIATTSNVSLRVPLATPVIPNASQMSNVTDIGIEGVETVEAASPAAVARALGPGGRVRGGGPSQ